MKFIVLSDSYIDGHRSVFSTDKLSEEKSENMEEELAKLRLMAKELEEKVHYLHGDSYEGSCPCLLQWSLHLQPVPGQEEEGSGGK